MAEYGEEGRISEWNEGAFKSTRLHQIQETLNQLWLNPSQHTNGKFNYDWIYQYIKRLHSEGYSKYNKKERDEADIKRDAVLLCLKKLTPLTVAKQQELGGGKQIYLINEASYELLIKYLDDYERFVKDLNDKHGLTTQNREEHGDWDF